MALSDAMLCLIAFCLVAFYLYTALSTGLSTALSTGLGTDMGTTLGTGSRRVMLLKA